MPPAAQLPPSSAALRRRAPWLALAAVLLLASGLGMREAWPPDEPRFVLVAREMVQGGDWLVPHRNGEVYAQKPPLGLWAMAATYAATGSLRLAAVLPSLLAALATLWLVVDLGRRLWGPRTGLYAGAALLATMQFVWQAHVGQLDAMLCLWTTLGFYGLARHLLLGPAWGWYALGGLAMGLGVITKGVGFLPLLALLPWLALRRWRAAGHATQAAPLPAPGGGWRWLLAPAALLAGIALWLVPLAAGGAGDAAAYREALLYGQTYQRYLAPEHHYQPAWYLLPQALALWLPLSLVLPWALPAWWRRLRRGDARFWLPLGWVALVLLFFSLSPGKRGVYVLPALPALALACAPLLGGLLRRRDVRIAAFALAALVALALLLASPGLNGLLLRGRLAERLAERELPLDALGMVAGLGALAVAAALLAWRLRGAPRALAATWIAGWSLLGWGAFPRLDELNCPRPFLERIAAAQGPGVALGMVAYREQYVLYAPGGLTTFGYARDPREQAWLAGRWLAADPRRRVLVPEQWLGEGPWDREAATFVGVRHRERWYLVGPSAVRAGTDAQTVRASVGR